MSGEPATQLVGERLLSGHRGAVAHQLNRPVSLADPIWEDLQVISGELHVEAPTEVDAMGDRLRQCMQQWPRGGLKDTETIDRLEFMRKARGLAVPFEISHDSIDPRMIAAANWVAATPSAEVIAWREAAVVSFEKRGITLRDMGCCDAWFHNANKDVQRVARRINGPLAEWVVQRSKYKDPLSVQLFRTGAKASGKLACSGACYCCFQSQAPFALASLCFSNSLFARRRCTKRI